MTCGTVIKLQHIGTNYHLHSHEVAYGSGSGQQSVTATSAGDDAGSYWVVKGLEVRLPTIPRPWHWRRSAARHYIGDCAPVAGLWQVGQVRSCIRPASSPERCCHKPAVTPLR